MADENTNQGLRIDPVATQALEYLMPRARGVFVAGVTIIVLGSAAVLVMALSPIASLTPIGIIMGLAFFLEAGVGHQARGQVEGGELSPPSPWSRSSVLLAIAAAATVTSSLLPGFVFTTIAGLALMGAGWVRLRATTFTPLRQKSAILLVSGSVTILIGVLIVTRWAGDDVVITGYLLAFELVASGWGLAGLGRTLAYASRP